MKTLIFLASLAPIVVCGQYWPDPNSYSTALGGISSSYISPWSISQNPALLSFSASSIGISTQNRFGLKELMNYSLQVNSQHKNSGFAVGADRFGFNLYQRNSVRSAYGIKMSEHFYAGVALNYSTVKIAESSQKSNALEGGIGLAYQNRKLLVGAEVQHFGKPLLETKIGLSYQISTGVKTYLELHSTQKIKKSYHFGFSYQPVEPLSLLLSIRSEPFSNGLGIAYDLKKTLISLGIQHHKILGYSSALSIVYKIRKS